MSRGLGLILCLPLLLAAGERSASPDPAREALEIEARLAALRTLESDIAAKLDALERLRTEAAVVLEEQETERQTNLATLIQFYQAMKPKQAAALLEKLPITLAADVVGQMKSRQAGKILDVMQAKRAVLISRRVAGNSPWRVAFRHVLPNSLAPSIVGATLVTGYAVLTVAGLAVLSVGIQPPTAEWGVMVGEGAKDVITGEWWTSLFPGGMIVVAVMAFHFIGDEFGAETTS